MTMNNFREVVNYTIKKRTSEWMIALLILLIICFAVIAFKCQLDNWFGNYLDPISALLTVFIGAGLWIMQLNRDWRESLPKRLTVHFKYHDKYVMTCYETWLSSASDIRNWSQQIGSQMSKEPRLDFMPFISAEPPKPIISKFEKDKNRPIVVMLFEVTFHLNSIEFRNLPDIKDRYLIWLDNTPTTGSTNLSFWVSKQPEAPMSIDQAYEYYQKQLVKDE